MARGREQVEDKAEAEVKVELNLEARPESKPICLWQKKRGRKWFG